MIEPSERSLLRSHESERELLVRALRRAVRVLSAYESCTVYSVLCASGMVYHVPGIEAYDYSSRRLDEYLW